MYLCSMMLHKFLGFVLGFKSSGISFMKMKIIAWSPYSMYAVDVLNTYRGAMSKNSKDKQGRFSSSAVTFLTNCWDRCSATAEDFS